MSFGPKHHLDVGLAARALQMAEEERIIAGGGHIPDPNAVKAAQDADPALDHLSDEQKQRLNQMGNMMMGKKGAGLFMASAMKSKSKEDPMRILSELRNVVTRLEKSEEFVAPAVTALEKKVSKLDATSTEMQPNVNMLMRSFEKVNSTVSAIEKMEIARAGVEKEKWASHKEEVEMQNEHFASALEACLKSEDLTAERFRVDGKIAALKLDLESLSGDQLRTLRTLMGNEVGKVVDHITNIKASFDSALSIMRQRVELIKDEFGEHKEDQAQEKQEKAVMQQQQAEATRRQEKAEEQLTNLASSLGEVAAQHGTELELLHRELDAANEAAEILANTVDEHIARTEAEVQRLDQKVDDLKEWTIAELATAKENSETYADASSQKVKVDLMRMIEKQAAEASSRGDSFAETTNALDRRLAALDLDRQKQNDVLTAGLESTNAALLAQWEATEAALARARDDVHAAMERQGGEIGSSLAALTEKRISELKSATDAELKKFAESIASQDRKGAQLEKQLETLRERADQAAVDAKELNRAFKTSEQLREQWQRQQDGASRSFRLELGAHLQQMEELLNDKVDSSRADVIRLGRSNVALCALVHQCRSRIQQLASAEEAAAEWRARLEAHAEMACNRITEEESTASVEKPFLLSVAFQKWCSGAVQNCAEIIALLADNDTVRGVLVHPHPESDDAGWDSQVEATRTMMARDFVASVYGRVAKHHPTIHPVTLQARTKLFTKYELALKVALSKHATVRASETLLGRRPLDACAACNRPITQGSSAAVPGDRRAIARDPLPGQTLALGERANSSWSPDRGRPGTTGSPAFGRHSTSGNGGGDDFMNNNSSSSGSRALVATGGSLSSGGGLRNSGNGHKGLGGYQGQGGTAGANGLPAQYVMRGGFRMPKKGSQSSLNNSTDGSMFKEHQLGQLPSNTGTENNFGARPGTAPSPGQANRW